MIFKNRLYLFFRKDAFWHLPKNRFSFFMLSYMNSFWGNIALRNPSKKKSLQCQFAVGNATGDQSDTYRLRGKYGLLYPRGWVLVGLEGVGARPNTY